VVLTCVFAVSLHVTGLGHSIGHCGWGHGRLVCSKIGHGSTGLDRSTRSGVSHLWCCGDQGLGAVLRRFSTGFYETKKSITSQIRHRFKRFNVSMNSGAGRTTIFPMHITFATNR
jgi:hypothetical protein